MTDHPLTKTKAEAHEALYPALARLTAQLEAMAIRKPAAPVPAATRAIAEDLLFEAQAFGWARAGRTPRGLPEPATDIAGLATQLGQALAILEAFELAHASWNADLNAFAWHVEGTSMPLKRLRQMPAAPKQSPKDERRKINYRKEVLRRFDIKIEEAYERGLRDGLDSSQHPVAGA